MKNPERDFILGDHEGLVPDNLIVDSRYGVFGVYFEPRGKDDNHVIVRFCHGDDGRFWTGDHSLSSGWLDAMIKVLTEAKKSLEKSASPDLHNGVQYGWKFSGRIPGKSVYEQKE